MGAITVPRSFEDTTPAEMMRNFSRRRSSSAHSPILDDAQPRSYDSIRPRQQALERDHDNQEHRPSEHREGQASSEAEGSPWIGRRIWDSVQQWERDHLELVLENKQSVARDHLGIISWKFSDVSERTNVSCLASDIFVICIHWRCSYSTVPIINDYTTGTTTEGLCRIASAWSTPWCDVHWNCSTCFGAGCTSVRHSVIFADDRYFMSQYWMTKGKFPASRGAVIVVSAIAASVRSFQNVTNLQITIAAFVIVIILDPDLQT